MSIASIRGVICPMVTPFDQDGALDLEATSRLVDFLVSHGVDGLMVAGTTGEGMLLDLDERRQLLEWVLERAAGRAAVIAHVGGMTTRESVALAAHARSVGASAVAVITPFFFPYDDEALYAHFLAVAEAAGETPVFLYAFPANARNDISPALFERLLEAAPNIVGMKSSNPSLLRLQEYLDLAGDRAGVFCGVDGLMLPALTMGARGQISGNANAFPEVFRDLYVAFTQGDLGRARQLQGLVNRIRRVLADGASPAYFKEALRCRGVSVGWVRPPMRELAPEEARAVRDGLRGLGLL
ncbi:MAG: 4-hydroxy-tetrahydrodipicolinate synthase [Anaerolineae bacterium]